MGLGAAHQVGAHAAGRVKRLAGDGVFGAGIPGQYPKLGAQHAGYIETQMLAFKKKERTNNSVMNDIAGRMSDADIKAVSSFISGLR